MKYIYTDGACPNNGKKNAIGGCGVYIPDENIRISKKLDKTDKQTNNVAELTAVSLALKYSDENTTIVTDSEYVIKCCTYYGGKIKKKKPNYELVKSIYPQCKNIKFLHVNSHTGKNDIHSVGNDIADKLANECLK